MKIKDLIFELKRFDFEMETNIDKLKKTKEGLIFKIRKDWDTTLDLKIRDSHKGNVKIKSESNISV